MPTAVYARCPVCHFPALATEGYFNEHDICPSCGTHIGYEDLGKTHLELRSAWLKSGNNWWAQHSCPEWWHVWLNHLRASWKQNDEWTELYYFGEAAYRHPLLSTFGSMSNVPDDIWNGYLKAIEDDRNQPEGPINKDQGIW